MHLFENLRSGRLSRRSIESGVCKIGWRVVWKCFIHQASERVVQVMEFCDAARVSVLNGREFPPVIVVGTSHHDLFEKFAGFSVCLDSSFNFLRIVKKYSIVGLCKRLGQHRLLCWTSMASPSTRFGTLSRGEIRLCRP
jgi:hypothetical protein